MMNKRTIYPTLVLLTLSLTALVLMALAPVPPSSSKAGGVLIGKVTDVRGMPVPNAAVEVLGTSPRLGSYTKRDGTFRIPRLTPGNHTIRVKATGYEQYDTTLKVRERGETSCGITLETSLKAIPREPADHLLSYRARPEGATDEDASAPTLEAVIEPPKGAPSKMASGRAAATKSFKKDGGKATKMRDRGEALEESRRKSASSTSSEERKEHAGQLTAGEWSDLKNWSYWKDITSDASWKGKLTYWGYDPAGRVPVRVTDGSHPVADAEIRLVDPQGKVVWRGRTNNRGWGELFSGITPGPKELHRVEVKRSGGYISAGMTTPGNGTPVVADIKEIGGKSNTLDLLFMIDVTGSMGDELDYVKGELEDVINRVRETSSDDLHVRLSCNVYRDKGDEFVVRSFPFSESSFEVVGQLRNQFAEGGGDFPEAVEDGLEDAIENHAWSASARARLLFLVLDAPPHYTQDRIRKLHKLTEQAAAKGIRIIPIASSGIDKETEFLLRLLAIYTEGTYIFLTDDSGIGNSHLKPTIGKYDVEFLNNLMVKVISRYVMDGSAMSVDGSGAEIR